MSAYNPQYRQYLSDDPVTQVPSFRTNSGAQFDLDLTRADDGHGNNNGAYQPSSPFASLTAKQKAFCQCADLAFYLQPYGTNPGAWTLSQLAQLNQTKGNVAVGSSVITSLLTSAPQFNTNHIAIGDQVIGAGVPNNSFISADSGSPVSSITIGSNTCTASTTQEDITITKGLSCGQYEKLAAEFFNILYPAAANNDPNHSSFDPNEAFIKALGWQGGVLVNHSQMMIYDPAAPTGLRWVLVDADWGIYALPGSYDDLLQGVPVPANKICSMYFNQASRQTQYASSPAIVRNALLNGSYAGEDMFYEYTGLANFNGLVPFGAR